MLRFGVVFLALLFQWAWDVVQSAEIPELNAENFESTTSRGIWFVEHYSPYCHHCIAFAPTWQQLADEHESWKESKHFYFAKVDCTMQGDLCKQHKVEAFPTLQLYVNGQHVDTFPLGQPRTWEALTNFMSDKVDMYLEDVIATPSPINIPNPDGVSVDLDMDQLKKIIGSGDPWFIKFYAPWCGFCKKLAPAWTQMAKDLRQQVNVGEVNCDAHRDTCVENGVKGFPTMKLFAHGSVYEYHDDRSLVSMVGFAKKMAGPTINKVNAAQLQRQLQQDSVAFVYLYTEGKDEASDLMHHVAAQFLDGLTFYSTNDPLAMRKLELAPADMPAAVIVKDGKHVVYPSHQFDNTVNVQQSLTAWIQAEKFPLVSQIGPANAPEILRGGRMVVVGIIHKGDKDALDKFRALAEAQNKQQKAAGQERVLFAQLEASTWGDYARTAYSIPRHQIPAIVIVDPPHSKYYNHDIKGQRFSMDTPEAVLQALQDIREGRLIGVSMLPLHARIGQKVQSGLQVLRVHWIMTSAAFLVICYMFYKPMCRRNLRSQILPVKQG